MKKPSYWVSCPICKGRTRIKIYEDTTLLHFPLYFPKCKQETCISIVQMKMVVVPEDSERTE